MYSKEIKILLKQIRAKIGDRITIECNGKNYTGLLMPRPEFGDKNTLVIKLDNGYNIGIKYKKGVKITKRESTIDESMRTELKKGFVKFDRDKPPVSMITTGGTIASRIDYRTGGVYALMKPNEILYNMPELADIIYLKNVLNPFTKMSEDMDYKDWIKTARLVVKELNSGNNGVIITHGTDTLHFTSAALSFMLRNLYKPVILVGAQRSSDRGSTDAFMNIICAAYVAISNIAEVGICMHGTINDDYCNFIRGTKVRKMDTQRRDAFKAINENPLARVYPNGKIEILNHLHKVRNDDEDVSLDTKFEPKVAMIKAYPGSDPEVMEYFVNKGYKGFVLEVMGIGHVPTFAEKSWIKTIKDTVKDGIPVVTAPQTIYGRINTDVYTNLRILYHDAKALSCKDMLPETAYVKLGWVLGHTQDINEVRKMMLTNYAGEISKRHTIRGKYEL